MPEFQKQNVKQLTERIKKNQYDIAHLKTLALNRSDVSVNKKLREIVLTSGLRITDEFAYDPITIRYFFKDLKEWMVPFFHVFTKVHTTSGFEVNNRFIYSTSYQWKEVSDGYDFILLFQGYLENMMNDTGSGGGGEIIVGAYYPMLIKAPLYLDVKLSVFNDHVWQEVQQLKG